VTGPADLKAYSEAMPPRHFASDNCASRKQNLVGASVGEKETERLIKKHELDKEILADQKDSETAN
jgi:hypothetical protein